MSDVFDYAVDEIIKLEGGYINNPSDPGGPTNMGITLKTLSAWRNTTCTAQDVSDLTTDEAKKIYKALYWDKVHGDDLKPAVALVLFDAAVNMGVGTSIRLAQRALHLAEDGIIGPQTLSSINRTDSLDFITSFMTERAIYYINLNTFNTFGKGWLHRLFTLAMESNNFIPVN